MEKNPVFKLLKILKLRKIGMRPEGHAAGMAGVHCNAQCLIQHIVQSVIINSYSFMMSLLHVLASRRSSSGRVRTKECRYTKFCQTCKRV